MLHALRQLVAQRSGLVLAFCAVLLVAAVLFARPDAATIDLSRAWYYNLETNSFFADDTRRLSPFLNEMQQTCVAARLMTGGDPSRAEDRILICYERYNDKTRLLLEQAEDRAEHHTALTAGLEVSADGRQWHPADSQAGRRIVFEGLHRYEDRFRGIPPKLCIPSR